MKDYLKEEFREFGHYPIPEKDRKIVEVLTLPELLKFYDETIDRHEDGKILDRKKYELYRREIWNRLSIASRRDITNLVFELHNEIDKQLTELKNQFKNHRHRTIMGLYTEKPNY